MKTELKTKDLLTALKTLKKVTYKRNTMPVLSNVAFIASPNGLKVEATNLDVTLTQTLDSNTYDSKTYLVEPSELIDFLSVSEDFYTTITQNSESLVFKTDNMSKSIDSAKTQDQTWPEVAKNLTLDYSLNIEGLSNVALAMSTDETRYHLCGVYFDSVNSCMVATDGHRLHKQDISGILTPLDSFILPSLAVNLLKDLTDEVRVSRLNNGYVCIALTDLLTASIRCIEGKYPTWQQFVPAKLNHSIKASSDDFKTMLKKASKLADKKSRSIAFDGQKITPGQNMSLDFKSESTINKKVGFNCDYLQDAISCIDSEDITIQVNDALSPCVIQNKTFTAVVMPMRV